MLNKKEFKDKNLELLLKSDVPVWVRVPVIGGVNDTIDEIKKIKAFFEKNCFPQKTKLMPYHNMGEHKYKALGKEAMQFEVPSKEFLKTTNYQENNYLKL